MRSRIFSGALALLTLGLLTLQAAEEERTWTSSDGAQIPAVLIAFDGDEVQLRTSKGVYKFPVSRLSKEDNDYLNAWLDNQPVEVGEWPEFVEVPLDLEVTIVEENADTSQYIYRSDHFEFRSSARLSQSVVRDFSRIFEATFAVVKELPVGLKPTPQESGFYLTELYETPQEYYDAGGPIGSAGVYTSNGNKIMIPLAFLGVEWTGTRWIMEPREDNGTLKHEITHQVMGRWLPLLPIWFIEGMADYVEAARYSKGRYSLKNMSGSIEEAVFRYRNEREFPMVGVEKLMTMTPMEWSEGLVSGRAQYNYPSSALLMFYFLHLDEEGDGAPVARYLAALNSGEEPQKALDEHLLRGREYEILEKEVRDQLRQVGIRVDISGY